MRSEGEPQSELNDSRIVSRVGDNAKCAAIHTGIRIGQPHAVKDVEHISPELKPHSLRNTRVLHNPEILAGVTWSPSVRQETGRIAKTKSETVAR